MFLSVLRVVPFKCSKYFYGQAALYDYWRHWFPPGAVLAVNGNMDGEGYYTATFEGITGRVPANFIQEVDVSDPAMKNRLFNQVHLVYTYHSHTIHCCT